MPGSSSTLLAGSDGGAYVTLNANTAQPVFSQLNNTLSTIEFYSGDITANFANSQRQARTPARRTTAHRSGPATPRSAQLPVGAAPGRRRHVRPHRAGAAASAGTWRTRTAASTCRTSGPYGPLISAKGGWGRDTLSFVFPYEIYKIRLPAHRLHPHDRRQPPRVGDHQRRHPG